MFVVEQIFLTKNSFIVSGLDARGNVVAVPFAMPGCCASALKELLVQPVVPPGGLQVLIVSVCEAVLLYCTTGVCLASMPIALQMFRIALIPVPGSLKPASKFAHLVLTPFTVHA